jgi:hypothetical protein
MNEIFKITEKYDVDFVKEGLSSLASINLFGSSLFGVDGNDFTWAT